MRVARLWGLCQWEFRRWELRLRKLHNGSKPHTTGAIRREPLCKAPPNESEHGLCALQRNLSGRTIRRLTKCTRKCCNLRSLESAAGRERDARPFRLQFAIEALVSLLYGVGQILTDPPTGTR